MRVWHTFRLYGTYNERLGGHMAVFSFPICFYPFFFWAYMGDCCLGHNSLLYPTLFLVYFIADLVRPRSYISRTSRCNCRTSGSGIGLAKSRVDD
jgi:hypothetical protein